MCHDKICHHLLHGPNTLEYSTYRDFCFIYGFSSTQHKVTVLTTRTKKPIPSPITRPYTNILQHRHRHIFRQVSQFLHLCLLSHGQPPARSHRLVVLFPKLGSSLYTIPAHHRYCSLLFSLSHSHSLKPRYLYRVSQEEISIF
jgi:hypothetical protein